VRDRLKEDNENGFAGKLPMATWAAMPTESSLATYVA